MASDGDQDGQCQEKVILKRKLTGPPRLILGKSKSMNQGSDRSEDRTKKRNQRENNNNGTQIDSTAKQSNIEAGDKESSHPSETSDNLHKSSKMDEDRASSEQPFDPSSWVAGSEENQAIKVQLEGHSKTGKSTGRGWKRVFSPALICVRRPRKFATAQDGNQVQADRRMHTHAQSTREDALSLSDACPDSVMKRRRRFNIRTWTTFKRLLTASYVRRQRPRQGNIVQEVTEDVPLQPEVTFRKRCQRLLMCGRKATSAAFLLQSRDTQCPGNKETKGELNRTQDQGQQSPATLQKGPSEVTGPCPERVTVNAEVIALQPNDIGPNTTRACQMSPLQRPISTTVARQGVEGVDTQTSPLSYTEETVILEPETSTSACTDSVLRVISVVMDTNEIQVDELHDNQCLGKDMVTQSAWAVVDTADSVAVDTNKHPSHSDPVISSRDVGEENGSVAEDQVFRSDRSSARTAAYGNGVVRSALSAANRARPNGHEVGEGSGESGPLLGEECLLVETAHSLVQAAISAAMEQLSVEQNGTNVGDHGEAQECRDHA
ncbi:uncharacterized protein si:dkey-1h6.8 [Esox lucius]|uniref:uncharacterized protein si:dkey-1h6.8 n=1 Tax=Esox lucius TaxID=8010 RepID=UPI0009732DD3|nr:uncharacterized protein si:dkey-1h6.8 [Esox lucius]